MDKNTEFLALDTPLIWEYIKQNFCFLRHNLTEEKLYYKFSTASCIRRCVWSPYVTLLQRFRVYFLLQLRSLLCFVSSFGEFFAGIVLRLPCCSRVIQSDPCSWALTEVRSDSNTHGVSQWDSDTLSLKEKNNATVTSCRGIFYSIFGHLGAVEPANAWSHCHLLGWWVKIICD